MKSIYYPLKNNWKIDEDSSIHPTEQIQRRVDMEDLYTQSKGYPLIKKVKKSIIKV